MDSTVGIIVDRTPEFRGRPIKVKPLAGGLTNRNFLIRNGRERFVLRLAGENSDLLGINRRTEILSGQAAFGLGISPEVLRTYTQPRALLTRFVPGKVMTPRSLRTPARLRQVASHLKQYHDTKVNAAEFSVFDTVARYYAEACRREVKFPSEISGALKALSRIQADVGVPSQLSFCHNDLLASNFIFDGQKMWLLDWEYAGRGDLFFDLGNLAANNEFGALHERLLLKLYFGRIAPKDLHRLRQMRMASDMREAMWGFLQVGISSLDFDYLKYAQAHLRRFLHSWERWNPAGKLTEGFNHGFRGSHG